MSKSRKKSPVYTDGKAGTTKKAKRFANKTVRNSDDIPSKGSGYKKSYCQYDIHDFKSRYTLREAILDWQTKPYIRKRYTSFKEYLHGWYKSHRMK